jgi:hypothetical protein
LDVETEAEGGAGFGEKLWLISFSGVSFALECFWPEFTKLLDGTCGGPCLAPIFPSFSSLPAALSIMLTLSPIVLDGICQNAVIQVFYEAIPNTRKWKQTIAPDFVNRNKSLNPGNLT